MTSRWEVYLWVPTKGWKLLRSFRIDNKKAVIELVKDFLPLEVKVVAPSGRSYYGGRYHRTDWDMPVFSSIRELDPSINPGPNELDEPSMLDPDRRTHDLVQE